MSRYRITLQSYLPKETLDYYFEAKSEDMAKKYLLFQMCKLMDREHLKFDHIYLSPDNFEIQVVHEKKTYFIGRLFCIPNRFPVIAADMWKMYNMDSIVKLVKGYCKSLHTAKPDLTRK